MGGTGLEPVTPSLSSGFSGADDLSLSPTFPAQKPFRGPHSTYFDDVPRETFVRLLCVGYELGSAPLGVPEVPTLDREIRRVIRTRLYESVELS